MFVRGEDEETNGGTGVFWGNGTSICAARGLYGRGGAGCGCRFSAYIIRCRGREDGEEVRRVSVGASGGLPEGFGESTCF